MIVGTGVDIVKISRFVGKADRPSFMKKIYTAQEQAYLRSRGAQSMAGLFAAKEAVAKALGVGFRGFWPRDIEIVHDEYGKPQVVLHGAAERDVNVFVSISHSETDAIAFAVIESKINTCDTTQ